MANKKGLVKKILIAVVLLVLAASAVVWYLFTKKFDDTQLVKAAFTVDALPFIKEFEKDDLQANRKYTEKIVVVNGLVSEIEKADTTVNIKMADTATGSYIIFAFQDKNREKISKVKVGDRISVKGSCSGGIYSEILETSVISFKRCVLNQ